MYIPSHISKEAQEFLKNLPLIEEVEPLQPDDLTGWEALRAMLHPIWQSYCENLDFEFKLTDTSFAGIPSVWLETPNTAYEDKILLYFHSGSYCLGGAKINCALPLQVAHYSGIKVLAVDYGKAPENPFPSALQDATNTYKALLDKGFSPDSIGWFGDSAGGGLTASGLLQLKQEGIPLPAAAGLISPWADLTGTGDTVQTLAKKDPLLYNWNLMKESVWAYCKDNDPANPLISSVYGDFIGLPPLLIQAGTKEILLSDSIRIYQQAKAVGVNVTLDLWDGMWHVFQAVPNIPEAQSACREMGEFLKYHLA